MAKTVSLTIRLKAEGKEQITAATKALDDLGVKYTEVGAKAKSASAAQGEHSTILDKIFNRIVQGIPTMFSLVAAYQALHQSIALLKAGMSELDTELENQQRIAVNLVQFGKFTDSLGRAVPAAQQWTSAMRVAGDATNYFNNLAKLTGINADALTESFGKLLSKGGPRGATVQGMLDLETAVAKLSPSLKDMEEKMNGIDTFLKNPSHRADLRLMLGLTDNQMNDIRKRGGDLNGIFNVILKKFQEDAAAVDLAPTFRKMADTIGQEFRGGIGEGLMKAFPQIKEQLNVLVFYAADFGKVFGQTLGSIVPSLALMITIITDLASLFNVLTEAVAAAASGLGTLTIFILKMAEATTGLPGVFDKTIAGIQELSDKAADSAVAAVERNRELKTSYESLAASLANPTAAIAKYSAAAKEAMAIDRIKVAGGAGYGGNYVPNVLPHNEDTTIAKSETALESLMRSLERLSQDNTFDKKMKEYEQYEDKLTSLSKKLSSSTDQQTIMKGFDLVAKARDNEIAKAKDFIDQSTQAIESLQERIAVGLGGSQDSWLTKELNKIQLTASEDTRAIDTLIKRLNEAGGEGSANLVKQLEAMKAAMPGLTASAEAWAKHLDDAKRALNETGDALPEIRVIMEEAAKSGANVVDAILARKDELLSLSTDFATGWKIGMLQVMREINTEAQSSYNLIVNLARSFQDAWSSALIAAFKGNQQGVKDAFKGFLDSILKQVADGASDSLMRSLKDAFKSGGIGDFLSGLFGQKKGAGSSGSTNFGDTKFATDANGNLTASQDVSVSASGGAGDNWLSENGQKLLSAAVGTYALAKQASGGQIDAGSGALLGAQAGSSFGIIGTVIGAIIGAAVGIFAHDDNKDPKNAGLVLGGFNSGTVHGGTLNPNFTTQIEADDYARRAQQILDRVQDAWLQAMLALPDKVFDKILALPPTTFNFPSTQKDPDQIHPEGTWGSNGPGAVVAGGKDYKTQYELLLDQVIPQGLADSYRPVAIGILTDLGFSEAKVKELNDRWKTLGEGFIGEFQSIVTSIVNLEDITKKTSFQNLFNKAGETADQTFGQTITTQGKDIGRMVALLNSGSLSVDNQVKLFAQINQSATQMHDNLLAYMQNLVQVSRAVKESINDQKLGIALDRTNGDKNAQAKILHSELDRVDTLMQTATDPAQVQALAQRAQQLIGQIYQLDPKAEADWADKQLDMLDSFVEQRLGQLGTEASDAWNAVIDPIKDSLQKFKDAIDGFVSQVPNPHQPDPNAPPGEPPAGGGNNDPGGNKGRFGGNPPWHYNPNMVNSGGGGGGFGGSDIYNNDPWNPVPITNGYATITAAQDANTASTKAATKALDDFQKKLDDFAAKNVSVQVTVPAPRAGVSRSGRTDRGDTGVL